MSGEKDKAAMLTELSLTLAAVFWGLNFAATKYAAEFIPPLLLVAIRSWISTWNALTVPKSRERDVGDLALGSLRRRRRTGSRHAGTGESSMMGGELLLGVRRGARENTKVYSTGNAKAKERSIQMVEKEAPVVSEAGLHARPAARFVKEAKSYSSDIVVVKDGREANAKSSLRLMTLGAKHGERVVVRAEGEDEEAGVEALVTILSEEEEE